DVFETEILSIFDKTTTVPFSPDTNCSNNSTWLSLAISGPIFLKSFKSAIRSRSSHEYRTLPPLVFAMTSSFLDSHIDAVHKPIPHLPKPDRSYFSIPYLSFR